MSCKVTSTLQVTLTATPSLTAGVMTVERIHAHPVFHNSLLFTPLAIIIWVQVTIIFLWGSFKYLPYNCFSGHLIHCSRKDKSLFFIVISCSHLSWLHVPIRETCSLHPHVPCPSLRAPCSAAHCLGLAFAVLLLNVCSSHIVAFTFSHHATFSLSACGNHSEI